VEAVEGGWRCAGWQAGAAGEELVLRSVGPAPRSSDGLDGLRALAVAHWARHPDGGRSAVLTAADERAAGALRGWGLSAG
jgi:hypothetical protein